jgi:hypothetical protein
MVLQAHLGSAVLAAGAVAQVQRLLALVAQVVSPAVLVAVVVLQ